MAPNAFCYAEMQKLHAPTDWFTWGEKREFPDKPERLDEVVVGARAAGANIVRPDDFGLDPIAAAHDLDYLSFLKTAPIEWEELRKRTGMPMSESVLPHLGINPQNPKGIGGKAAKYLEGGSCPVYGIVEFQGELVSKTYLSAYWSAQCAIAAAQDIIDGASVSVAACRLSGHHALRAQYAGFCALNNEVIAALHLLRQPQFRRVAIVDTDVHYGQGIQQILQHRDDSLCISIHADTKDLYPLDGGDDDVRSKAPGGYSVRNFPMPPGTDEAGFFDRLEQAMEAVKRFQPDAIVWAHGADLDSQDPQALMGGVGIGQDKFWNVGSILGSYDGPIVVTQNGGYKMKTLAAISRLAYGGLFESKR